MHGGYEIFQGEPDETYRERKAERADVCLWCGKHSDIDRYSVAFTALRTDMGEIINHGIDPVWNENSSVLILGSFPSVKSRETSFFYGHKQNRFWRVIAELFCCEVPETVDDKKQLLLKNRIALWDVIASCEITGSSDSSIRNVTANNIVPIINSSRIKAIFTNGATADRLYNRYIYPQTRIKSVKLPSTSPANAAKSFDKLLSDWAIVKDAVFDTSS